MSKNVFTKLISLVIALVLALSVCLPALAAAVEVTTREKYDTVLNEVVLEKYEEVIAATTEEEVEAILLGLTKENIEAILQKMTEEQQTQWMEHIDYLYGKWYDFDVYEQQTFTKGFYVNGELVYGKALRDALFAIEEDHTFRLAVNQYNFGQGGSLEGTLSDVQSKRITNAMIHWGFDVTGTSADLTNLSFGSIYNLRINARASTLPEWPNEGAIKLDKDAVAVPGKDNVWEITLQIQGKNFRTTSDVVLVIDNSNSMYDERMINAKIAAKAFVDNLLTENSTTRVAVVVFGSGLIDTTDFYTYTNKEQLKTYIDSIRQQMNGDGGGTNIQAGIHAADALLYSTASTGRLKNIVLLADGKPTYGYPWVTTGTYVGCDSYHIVTGMRGGELTNVGSEYTVDYSRVIGSGSAYEVTTNAQVYAYDEEHDRYGYLSANGIVNVNGILVSGSGTNLGIGTIWEANQTKAKGTTFYSVALQAGSDGEYVLQNCATDASKGYFEIEENETDVAGKLNTAFTSIAGSIAIAASKGIVLDPMGEKVELSFNDANAAGPVVTTDLAVYNAGNADVYISQGSIEYNQTSHTFDWKVGNVNEGTPVVLKYRVKIREGVEVSKGETIPTNKSTSFTYKDYQQNDQTQEFPIPNVSVGGGTIMVHWYLVNENGQPINADGVVVEGKEFAYQLQEAAYHTIDGLAAMEYNTSYKIEADSFIDYSYHSYVWNTAMGTQDYVNVTIPPTASSQHVWFAYTEVKNGSLTITKNVTDELFTTGSFTFTVTPPAGETLPAGLADVTGVTVANNVATVVVPITSGTGAVTLPDLPAGDYTVQELNAANYTTTVKVGEAAAVTGTSATVAVPAGDDAAVVFSNVRKLGNLKISKTVQGEYAPAVPFTFQVTLNGTGTATYPYKVYNTSDNTEVENAAGTIGGSVNTIALKDGQYALITGIQQGVQYSVEEINIPTGFAVTPTTASGNISETAVAEAAFTNVHQVGSLTITKTVSGEVEEGQRFLFKVTDDANKQIAEVVLAAGSSVTLDNLPLGDYTVTEDVSWSLRYTVDDAEQTKAVTLNGNTPFNFTNTRKANDQWLDANAGVHNEFATDTETSY